MTTTSAPSARLAQALRRRLRLDEQAGGAFRVRRIALAIVTALGGRGVGMLLQLAIMPLAIRVLGPEQFGLYAMLTAVMGWLFVAQLGVGPGLTLRLSTAIAADDRARQRALVTTALLLMGGLTALALLGFAALVALVGLPTLLGEVAIAQRDTVVPSLLAIALFLGLSLTLGAAEATQASFQEQHVNNLWAVAGNALTIVAIVTLVVGLQALTVFTLVVAVWGSMTLTRVANAVGLFVRRPYLLGLRSVRRDLAIGLLGVGGAFMAGQLASAMIQQGSVVIIGRFVGPEAAGGFAVLLQLTNIAFTVVLTLAGPWWPALTDAHVRGDRRWLRRAALVGVSALTAYGVGVGLTVALAGDHIIRLWIAEAFAPEAALRAAMGLWFALVVWDQVHFFGAVAVGRTTGSAVAYLASAIVILVVGLALTPALGALGMAIALCVGSLACTSWALPLIAWRAILRSPARGGAEAAASL